MISSGRINTSISRVTCPGTDTRTSHAHTHAIMGHSPGYRYSHLACSYPRHQYHSRPRRRDSIPKSNLLSAVFRMRRVGDTIVACCTPCCPAASVITQFRYRGITGLCGGQNPQLYTALSRSHTVLYRPFSPLGVITMISLTLHNRFL